MILIGGTCVLSFLSSYPKHYSTFTEIMSLEMCSVIKKLLLKKQQHSAMATFEMDMLSHQEKRKDILTSLVDNVLSSLDEADEVIVETRRGKALIL